MRRWILFFCIAGGWLGGSAFEGRADEIRSLMRGARAQAMGNAFTAVADDEEAIFYNPAGLAGIRKFLLNLATVNAEASTDLVGMYPGILTSFQNFNAASVNQFIGKNLYLKAQGTGSLVIPGFGVAGLYDQQVGIRLKNTAVPTGSLGTINTYGGQFGFGVPILRLKRRKGAELRFGMAFKALWRSGGYRVPTLAQILALDYHSLIDNLTTIGMGYGVDTGFQFVLPVKKVTLMGGLVYKDMGDTSFTSGAESIKSNLVVGVAANYKAGDLSATLAMDYDRLLDGIDWRKKTHIGLEMKFPVFSLYAGLNQLYPTYGASLDLWLLKLMYLSYAEELGTLLYQDAERRHMISIAINLKL